LPNPSNEISQAAKKAGLTYWGYMEKKRPSIVQKFAWGVKKVTRKQKREENDELMSAMATYNHPVMRVMGQLRTILKGNSQY